MRSWQQVEALAGARDGPALARVPGEERRAWQALWADVAALAARDPAALFDQARAHVGRREWKEAGTCYAEGFDLDSNDDGELWFEYAACQLLAGDREGYRRACAHLLARCQAAARMRPYLAARACTLAPGSTDDPGLPGRVAEKELAQSPTAYWSLTEQAALKFRTTRAQNAVPLLERSLVADGLPGRAVLNWLWLALVHHRHGNAVEARLWLDRAAQWLDQQGDRMPADTKDLGMHRHAWLEAHVLRKEAERFLAAAN